MYHYALSYDDCSIYESSFIDRSLQFSSNFKIFRGEAIALVKLSIILLSNSHNFTYVTGFEITHLPRTIINI